MNVYSEQDKQKMDQLAGYLAHGLEHGVAGASVGYSASRVSQLLQDEDFKELVAAKTKEIAQRFVQTNENYDKLENLAVRNLLMHVGVNADPDLNLRVAMLANRAVRRGQVNPSGAPQLSAQNSGQTIVLNLSASFVKSVQVNGLVNDTQDAVAFAKTLQSANPAQVNNLLTEVMKNGSAKEVVTMTQAGFVDMFTPIDK